jgi:hypothetical protein
MVNSRALTQLNRIDQLRRSHQPGISKQARIINFALRCLPTSSQRELMASEILQRNMVRQKSIDAYFSLLSLQEINRNYFMPENFGDVRIAGPYLESLVRLFSERAEKGDEDALESLESVLIEMVELGIITELNDPRLSLLRNTKARESASLSEKYQLSRVNSLKEKATKNIEHIITDFGPEPRNFDEVFDINREINISRLKSKQDDDNGAWHFIEQKDSKKLETLIAGLMQTNFNQNLTELSAIFYLLVDNSWLTDHNLAALNKFLERLLILGSNNPFYLSYYVDVLMIMIEREFIKDFDHPLIASALPILGESARSKVIITMFRKGILDKQVFVGVNENDSVCPHYALKLSQFTLLGLTDKEATSLHSDAESLLKRIFKTNRKAAREDKKISLGELELFLHGLANLQFISAQSAKALVSNHCQRGYLPLLEKDIKHAAELSSEYVLALRETCKGLNSNQLTPNKMMQLVEFAIAFETLGLGPERFAQAQQADSLDSIIHNLSKSVVKSMAQELDLEVDVDSQTGFHMVLDEWDLSNLGSLAAVSKRWGKDDQPLFKLALKAALEGKFQALVFPKEYDEETFAAYPRDLREAADQVMAHNRRIIDQARRSGLNVVAWHSPEKFEPRPLTNSIVLRSWEVVSGDLKTRFRRFEQWLENESIREHPVFQKNYRAARRSLGPLGNFMDGRGKSSLNLFKQKNNLNRLLKVLEWIKANRETTPEVVHDLIQSIYEFKNYDHDRFKRQPKPLVMRFWRRFIGRDPMLGNKVGSCTSLDTDPRSIFEFLLDLGTIYCILEDPNTGQEVGYARFYLSQRRDKQLTISIDSADGQANHGDFQPIPEIEDYIKDFAESCGINRENVCFARGTNGEKLGGGLTDDYLDHGAMDYLF